MIISHQHKFIFFAVPKTATHAVRTALREHLGPDDWEQQVLFGRQSLPIEAIARIGHGHITAREIRPHLATETWDDYFKFGFVRNPYDRYVSLCFFLNRGNPNFAQNAVSFMKRALSLPRFRQRVLVRPQYEQLCDPNGEVALDYVGRYERLQDTYTELCARIGVDDTNLARKNTSAHASFADYYDDELREIVADYYADDLRIFDYDFPPTN